ncbi:hypothetical protein EI42_05740 [Thermosporothrix hazakensis]|uniref:Uncharacterized protein n=2 Tax=Thermosporothrix hazakensis TaxID=644383 RepID=A0A326TYV8_THEHA|nr:hypothetical protein EI42_05740 [Thermosporothrix hazakensis]
MPIGDCLHLQTEYHPRNLWIGATYKRVRNELHFWIGFFPCFSIHIVYSRKLYRCPECGALSFFADDMRYSIPNVYNPFWREIEAELLDFMQHEGNIPLIQKRICPHGHSLYICEDGQVVSSQEYEMYAAAWEEHSFPF